MLSKNRVGFLTIGQSPREDIMNEMKPLLSAQIDVMEYGLLDDLGHDTIESLAPNEQEIPLVSRLRDGGQALLSERKISELLPDAIKYMKTEMNVEAVGVLCTHEFPKMEFSYPVIFPSERMKLQIDERTDVQKAGVVVPLENQIEMAHKKWGYKRAFVVSKSPYEKGKTWKDVADVLMEEKVDAVILDCIGYSVQDENALHSLLDVPILLPRTILASAINQIF
jgi:protein AroM